MSNTTQLSITGGVKKNKRTGELDMTIDIGVGDKTVTLSLDEARGFAEAMVSSVMAADAVLDGDMETLKEIREKMEDLSD